MLKPLEKDYDINKINSMVNVVINKSFTTDLLWEGTQKITERDDSVPIEEPDKELKGVLTDFVTNEFFKTPEQLKNFIKLVYGVYNTALSEYRAKLGLGDKSLFFVYKGGNILRIIALESMYSLPKNVSNKIIEYYKDAFKRSDADFSIYIDPRLPNFDQINSDMPNLSYLLLNYIRNIFLKNLTKYFEYFKVNDVEKVRLLNEQLTKLNETTTVKEKKGGYDGIFNALIFGPQQTSIAGFENYSYKPREDFEMGFTPETNMNNPIKPLFEINLTPLHFIDKNNKKQVILEKQLKDVVDEEKEVFKGLKYSTIFSSINKTTTFRKGNTFTSFNLTRSKFLFNTNFVKADGIPVFQRLGGELIDVTILNKKDDAINSFFEHLNENIFEYKLISPNEEFKFIGYSINYLAKDLERMLFGQNMFPWEDLKYAKRLKRLLYMYFLELITAKSFTNKGRIQYLNFIHKQIIQPTLEHLKQNNYDFNSIYVSIRKYLVYSKDKKVPFKNLIKHLLELLFKNEGIDYEKLKDYVLSINENLDVIIPTFEMLQNYIERDGTISENSLYNTEQLSGGFIKKKYKKTY